MLTAILLGRTHKILHIGIKKNSDCKIQVNMTLAVCF